MVTTVDTFEEEVEPIKRLSKDLLDASRKLSKDEVRYIVDGYYQIQGYRIATRNQARQAYEQDEPESLLTYLGDQASVIEGQIKRAMQEWVESQRVGRWLLSVKGIGPVLAAGLLAHLDITKAPTAGHFWSFAGLNPNQEWLKGQKRPFNAKLKTLCWKVGDSFVKVSGRDGAVYGKAYKQRKVFELEHKADHPEQVEKQMQKRLSDNQKQYYSKGELAPLHIDMRARRWTVKLFLAHLQHVMYEDYYNEKPPKPYVIEHLGHVDYIAPANWPIE